MNIINLYQNKCTIISIKFCRFPLCELKSLCFNQVSYDKILFVFFLLIKCCYSSTQCQFQMDWEYRYPGFVSPLTLEADKLGKTFLYATSNEYGLKIPSIFL